MSKLDYLNIITSQHRTKEKFVSFVDAFLEIIDDVDWCASTFNKEFSLEVASGSQQDILGEILNVKRKLQNLVTSETGLLDDESYRMLLFSKVAKDRWDGSIQGLYEVWSLMFPNDPILIEDNQDMTATILLLSGITPLQLELLQNGLLIPKPVGVKMTYIDVVGALFAYDADPFSGGVDYLAGYDLSVWAEEIIV